MGAAPLERVKAIQGQLAASTDLNPLFELLELARKLHGDLLETQDKDKLKALTLAVRVLSQSLVALCASGALDVAHVTDTGLLALGEASNEPRVQVARWMKEQWNAYVQFVVETLLVSPVSPHTILIGYTIGGALRGLAVAFIVTLLSLFFTHLQVHHLGVTVLVILLTAITFSLGGFINAVFARNFDDISIIPTFVLTPLTYLGGVFYSINLLSPFWQTLSLANPVLHMVNAFRYGILGVSDIRIGVAISFMLVAVAALYLVSVGLLKSGRGMRQ